MQLITPVLVLASLLLVKQCQSAEEKGFYCPESGETSLMTTVVSGCKVYYTCENGAVLKIFRCSESRESAGTAHACEENPQCLTINFLQELKTFPEIFEELKSLKSEAEIENVKSSINASMDSVVRFIKCLGDVDNIDDLSKTCIDSTLFQNKPFMNIELSPKILEAYSKLFNVSIKSEDKKENQMLRKSFGKVLKAFVTYLASDCEMVCKRVPKPDYSAEDVSESSQDQSAIDSKHTSEGSYGQLETGDRVRRSQPSNSFRLMNVLLNPRVLLETPIPNAGQPVKTPAVEEVKSKMDDNSTLMASVIVPIIKDIVNDEEALKNITNYFRAVFEAVVPLATEILKASNNSFDLNRKVILKIPRAMVQSTVRRIHDEAYPILISFLNAKLPSILLLLADNTKLLFRSWDEMESRLEPNLKELRGKGIELFRKYVGMYRSSTSKYIHTYSLIEIQQDIESLYSLLPDVSKELALKNWSVFQDVTGITTESVADLLLDVPGIFEAIEAIPFDQLMYFFLLLL